MKALDRFPFGEPIVGGEGRNRGVVSTVRRAACLALALLALLPVVAYFLANPPFSLRLLVAALVAISIVRPAAGWLALAGLAPFGDLLGRLAHSRWAVTEPLVLAFLAGWLVREAFRRQGQDGSAPCDRLALDLAGLFAVAVVASLAVQLVVLQVSTAFPLDFARFVWRFAWHDYYTRAGSLPAVTGAAFVLEGIGLFAASVVLTIRRAAIVRSGAAVFAAAASLVAAVNLGALAREAVALKRVGPVTVQDVLALRISYVFPDVNAAGSYFVMALFVAGGLALSARLLRVRLAWTLAAVLMVLGIWLTGSRTAFAAAPLAAVCLAVVLAVRRGRSAARGLVAVFAGLALLAGVFVVLSNRSTAGNVEWSVESRAEMAARALLMFRDHPVFGVGAGRFYAVSYHYPLPGGRFNFPRENAHNNFLQVLTELGIVGFTLLLSLLAVVIDPVHRRTREPSDAGWTAATTAGIVAFVATWVTGHPLLTREVALAFWLVLGLVAGAHVNTEAHREKSTVRRRWRGGILLACALLIAGLVPVRAMDRLARTDLTRKGRGFSAWHRDAGGETRFRWMFRRAVLYVPANARQVSIRMRSPGGVATVRVVVAGKQAVQLLVAGEGWRDARIEVPPDYRWRSVPVALQVRAFQPLAGTVVRGTPAETRIQVALPSVIE